MRLLLLALVAIAFAGPATAADLPARYPYRAVPAAAPLTSVYSWSGVYVGGHGGYGWARAHWSDIQALDTASEDDTLSGEGPRHKPQGPMAGGHLGFQYQWGWVVAGLEFSGAWAKLQANSCCEFGVLDDHYTTTINSLYQVVGRLGFAAGVWHGYIKGGYAGARVGIELVDHVGTPTSGISKQWTDGFVLGGGLEYAITPYVILGVDYSYIQLNDRPHTLDLIGDGAVTYNVAIPAIQAVVGRVSYKFNVPSVW
jgi:outer membrane immunogenic protein